MKRFVVLLLCVLLIPLVSALEGFSSPQASVSLGSSLVVSDSVVYSSGFVSDDGSTWEQFSFSGRQRGNWIVGTATSNVRTNANYYAIYSCSWSSGWSCSDGWEVYDQSTQPPSEYIPKDSVQGDFEALQALYQSTQGQGVAVLNDVSELPSKQNARYPYMYLIDGDIYSLDRDKDSKFTSWNNYGAPWPDTTGWESMTPETMGDAVGVTTDENGRVTMLDMWRINFRDNGASNPGYYGNNLVGVLPPEISNLAEAEYIYLKSNFLHGELPDLSGLVSVKELSLAGQDQFLLYATYNDRDQWHESNHWSGDGKAVVTTNRFKTDIPAEIDGFQDLALFEMRRQYLTGRMPEWSNLPSIKAIFIDANYDIEDNQLSGPIPESWGDLTTTVFFKGPSGLSGQFPQRVDDNWDDVAHFTVGRGSLSGDMPEFLNSRDKLYIGLARNNFTGGFPAGHFNGDNSRMIKWQISENSLSGEIPEMAYPGDPNYDDAEIKAPVYPPTSRTNYRVTAPGFGRNSFTGPVPQWIQGMHHLQTWYIVGNSFSGPFPKTVAEQDKLKTFYIHDNDFSGDLPDVSWGDRDNDWMFMQNNNFSGEIPDSWISTVAKRSNNMPWEPAPTDGNPQYNTFTGTGATLTWDAVTNAVAYEVEIVDSDDEFVTSLTVLPASATVSGLPAGVYKWRVRGLDWEKDFNRLNFAVSNNQLSGRIPDWYLNIDSNDVQNINFRQNRYTFRDIGPVYDSLKAHLGDKIKFGDQKPFGDTQSFTRSVGDSLSLDLSEFEYSGNVYQWTKDGQVLSGETSSVLQVNSLSSSDEGSYVLQVTNSDLSELGMHSSQPIVVNIS